MNNNQISNPKVEVSSGVSLNDKDYINCLLSTLKEMSKGYSLAMTEASNETLYNVYRESFLAISSLQREVYELMFRKGWYILESSDDTKIGTKYNVLLQEYQDLSV
jgi:spore coat protein CotF